MEGVGRLWRKGQAGKGGFKEDKEKRPVEMRTQVGLSCNLSPILPKRRESTSIPLTVTNHLFPTKLKYLTCLVICL